MNDTDYKVRQDTQMPGGAQQVQGGTVQQVPKPSDIVMQPRPRTLYDTKVKENFHIFGVASFLYACLYAFCMYKNNSGITYPFFVAGSLVFICFCLSKLGISWKKGGFFYMISMVLLSVSTFCTDDGRIIFFNHAGVFLLTLSLLLDVTYRTEKWNLGKYLGSIVGTGVMAIGEIGSPFADAVWYCKNKLDKKNSKYLYILIGLAITIPVFLVVFLLLTSADAVFKNMADRALSGLDMSDMFPIAFMIGFMFLASYCILTVLCKKGLNEEVRDTRNWEALIAIPVAGIMTALYLVFSGVQILYLFIGNMELPAGYTYAEYAREGFFQLLAVSIINLIMVLVGLCYFKKSKVLKGILVVMSFCTFIMIASSAMRMIIYIQYYYLTFLRILVLWGLAVLALIFAGVVAYVFKERFPLFRYSMVVVTCLYLCLSFSHPDYWIAKVNLAGSQETRSEFFKGEQYSDYDFLAELNADAAPVMLAWADEIGCNLEYYFYCQEEGVHYNDREYQSDAAGNWIEASAYERSNAYQYLENLKERVGDVTIRNFNVSRVLADQNVVWRTKRGI